MPRRRLSRLLAIVAASLCLAVLAPGVSLVRAQDVSLRDYIERILDERTRAQQAEVAASAKTLDTTAEALREKLLEMNQFRLQIERERMLYVQKDALLKDVGSLADRIRVLEEKSANLDGRFWALGIGLTVFTALINLAVGWFSRRATRGSS